ncbi:MAG: N-acetylmuramic acid 6-phosphate etherase [Alphaproteobacteria bacterium]|nr:N-acetylmuramic acid 6-phosphate etherase [Alphaproteobacteria bacterium]MBU0859154.1 N-acetylmuramic acid 6-phosphate etherase [Alphaproteobacteria bacterium]
MKQTKTETADDRFKGIDQWPGDQVLLAVIESQEKSVTAVRAAIPMMAAAADEAAKRLRGTQGRLVYIGAGTPARLAVQDGSELTPTYGWPRVRLAFVIAGREKALLQPVEGAEDDVQAALDAIAELNLTRDDVCIAVSASGTTPFTVAAMRAAKARGAQTVGIASNPDTPLLQDADFALFLDSGAEPVAGSTRMNAGTAQKVALNMFSTLTMIKLSRVYDGMMVDMELTNAKLRKRAVRMIGEITGCTADEATQALSKAGDSIKLAVLVVKGLAPEEGKTLLKNCDGNLRNALIQLRP